MTVGHRDAFEAMVCAIEQHRIARVVDRVFAFDALKAGMAHLRSGRQSGRIAISHA